MNNSYVAFSIVYLLFIIFLWFMRRVVKNDGLIDLGWPIGLLAMPLFFHSHTEVGYNVLSLICFFYLFCGLRFVVGWTHRTLSHGEDHRWPLWRKRWQTSGSMVGSKNIELNFLGFYLAQGFVNVLVFYKPIALAANQVESITAWFWFAGAIWLAGIVIENIADYQLDRFKKNTKEKGVLRAGLWAHSRHPNYFGEFLLWVAYALFALLLAQNLWDVLQLLFVPAAAYYFLVYFTGIPITEQSSLAKRGKSYSDYQDSVPMFFPKFFQEKNN